MELFSNGGECPRDDCGEREFGKMKGHVNWPFTYEWQNTKAV